MESIYLTKTFNRVKELRKKQPEWNSFFSAEKIYWNDIELFGWETIKHKIIEYFPLFIHPYFAGGVQRTPRVLNILFDIGNQIIRLIVPPWPASLQRIFGDARYDIAKLRHSVSGFYDFIMADLFEVVSKGVEFSGKIFVNSTQKQLSDLFDQITIKMGY